MANIVPNKVVEFEANHHHLIKSPSEGDLINKSNDENMLSQPGQSNGGKVPDTPIYQPTGQKVSDFLEAVEER